MHDQQQSENRPFDRHRDGSLECAIWRKETVKGVMYNTELKRSYRDESGDWHKTTSIPDRDLLRAARLQEQAYGTIQKAREQDRAQYVQRQQKTARPENQPSQERMR